MRKWEFTIKPVSIVDNSKIQHLAKLADFVKDTSFADNREEKNSIIHF